MKYTGHIVDNIFYLEDIYHCVFLQAGLKMKKRVYKNDIPIIDIDLKLKIDILNSIHKITFLEKGISSEMVYNGFFKSFYTLKTNTDIYDIYPHRGRKTSIYKNNKQIAYYEKRLFNRFNKKGITLVSDSNADLDVLFSIIATIDFDVEDDAYTATIDLGNILQSRKFDKEWKPS